MTSNNIDNQISWLETIHQICIAEEPIYDASVLTNQGEKWNVYRRMVRGRFRDLLKSAAPRFSSLIGQDILEIWLTKWLMHEGPSTRLFWQLPLTTIKSAEILNSQSILSNWQLELLFLELTIWEIKHASFPQNTSFTSIEFDRAPVFVNAYKRLNFTYNVHEIPFPQNQSVENPFNPWKPTEQLYSLIVFRRTDDSVGVRSINTVGAALLDACLMASNQTLTERIQYVLQNKNIVTTQSFIEGLSNLLAEWIDDGLLLGSASIIT